MAGGGGRIGVGAGAGACPAAVVIAAVIVGCGCRGLAGLFVGRHVYTMVMISSSGSTIYSHVWQVL